MCVIADSTIGRVAESAACAEKFEREGSRCHHYRNQLLVLWPETMDSAPAPAESSLIQRYRASLGRLSGCRISRTRTERAACIRYLRT